VLNIQSSRQCKSKPHLDITAEEGTRARTVKTKLTNTDDDEKKKEPLHTLCRNVKTYNHNRKQCECF
jgi:hypothetical protein